MHWRTGILLLGTALLLTLSLLSACGGATEPTTAPTEEPEQPAPPAEPMVAPTEEPEQPAPPDGQALVQQRCIQCHGLGRIQQASKTEAEWATTVARMVGKGANLSPEEQEAVIQYLAETYGP